MWNYRLLLALFPMSFWREWPLWRHACECACVCQTVHPPLSYYSLVSTITVVSLISIWVDPDEKFRFWTFHWSYWETCLKYLWRNKHGHNLLKDWTRLHSKRTTLYISRIWKINTLLFPIATRLLMHPV